MPDSKEKNHDYYQQAARDYHARNRDRDLSPFYEAFEKRLAGKRILDLGCGTGRDAAYFTSQGYEVVGLDFSSEMLTIAKHVAPKANFIEADLSDDLTDLGTFDGVWAMASLLHLPEDEFEGTLVRVDKALNDQSPFFVSLKEADYLDVGARDFFYWSKEKAEALFERLGYRVLFYEKSGSERSLFLNWILVAG